MVTLKDISAACGVSIAAVSRALNDHSDIGEGTKQRIREMAERMGYEKYHIEKNRMPSHMVGLIVTKDAESFFYHTVIFHLWQYLMERGYDLVLLGPDEEKKNEIRRPGYLPRARYLGLDAIFLISTLSEEELFQPQAQNGLRNLLFEDIPIVSIGCSYASFGSVLPAYEEGICKLFSHLCDCKCKRVFYVYKENRKAAEQLERLAGRAAEEMGISLEPAGCFPNEGNGSREAYEKTLELLEREKPGPGDCILYSDGFLLEGGMEALWQSRIRVPQDILVASLRFTRVNGICNKVTSWQLLPSDIAKEAAELLFREFRAPGASSRQTCRVHGELNCGITTAVTEDPGNPRQTGHFPEEDTQDHEHIQEYTERVDQGTGEGRTK